jgi:hypothetical protein
MSLIDPRNSTYNAILVFVIVMIGLVLYKPAFLYDHEAKKFKEFGNGVGQTYFSLHSVGAAVAVLLYLVFSHIESHHRMGSMLAKQRRVPFDTDSTNY